MDGHHYYSIDIHKGICWLGERVAYSCVMTLLSNAKVTDIGWRCLWCRRGGMPLKTTSSPWGQAPWEQNNVAIP